MTTNNTTLLIINQRFREEISPAQQAMAEAHLKNGGKVTLRQNCDATNPPHELVELDRAKIIAKAAQPVAPVESIEPKPWREWSYTTASWQYN